MEKKLFQAKVIWINPNDIHDVEKRGKIIYPRAGYQKSDYIDAAIGFRGISFFKIMEYLKRNLEQ